MNDKPRYPWTPEALEYHFDDWVFGHTMNKDQGKMCRDVVAGYLYSLGINDIDNPAAEIAALREEVATYERITDTLTDKAVDLTLENTTLREAVKLLGAELKEKIQEVQDHERHMSGKAYSLAIPSSLLSNPIAAAAVRGEP